MLGIMLPIFFALLGLGPLGIQAQSSTADVGPLLTCDLTTFACPGVNGCCPISGCCGAGCCPLGYACINEGTSDQTCCPTSDPTRCGTVDPDSDSDSDSDSGSGACIGIDNCPRDPERGLAWTCVLGQTCGWSYGECNPCVPSTGGGGDDDNEDDGQDNDGQDNDGQDSDEPDDNSTNSNDDPSDSSDSSDNSNSGHSLKDACLYSF
ncbi:hypothetical protein B0I35DRAFT_411630 [Stachybotrys elegans]|uniref:Chitin-binding type-1 domain-containing protein n=1 Tax=Stachybotrys elegans TaxID=80388 RepID=A0A8K0SLZ9_9HYPO|nr:hypothetical protein B0I35DRAFT_411630 [Stachybotrys elegans]